MRAYVCMINPGGLNRFLPEDAVPPDVLLQLVRHWCSGATTVVWAAIAEDAADSVRHELAAGHPHAACGLLLNQAAELLPIAAATPELTKAVFFPGYV